MIRHKWINDTCQRCGLTREKRMQEKYQRTIGVLRHGIWEDKHLYTENLRYYYGDTHKFERPDCTTP